MVFGTQGLQFGSVLMVCSANPEEPRSCEDRENISLNARNRAAIFSACDTERFSELRAIKSSMCEVSLFWVSSFAMLSVPREFTLSKVSVSTGSYTQPMETVYSKNGGSTGVNRKNVKHRAMCR